MVGLLLGKCQAYNPVYGHSINRVEIITSVQRRRRWTAPVKPPNHKRVYRAMKVHGLLLDRHAGGGRVAP